MLFVFVRMRAIACIELLHGEIVKRSLCPHCRKRLLDGERIHPECVEPWAEAQAEKADRKRSKAVKTAAKEERARDKEKREKMKSRGEWMKEAQQAFNDFIRARDREAGWPCISSGKPLDWSGNAVDAGHMRSVGSAPHMRFVEMNVHAQSKHDNQYLAGNALEYRKGMIARYGLELVESLEADQTVRKYSIDDLKEIRDTYRKKAREIKARNGW